MKSAALPPPRSPAAGPSASRRRWLAAGAGLGAAWALGLPQRLQAAPAPITVEVWKSPSCGCCGDWMAHMARHGFAFQVHAIGNTAARQRLKIPAALGSCHTASVQGYALEGHVPATDVQRLLKERPRAIGLAVPGMPIGSPGMDGPAYGGRRDPFDTLLVLQDGSTRVFQAHRG